MPENSSIRRSTHRKNSGSEKTAKQNPSTAAQFWPNFPSSIDVHSPQCLDESFSRTKTHSAQIQRTVSRHSRCRPNVHGAPADPLAVLGQVDALAGGMAQGASNGLVLEAGLMGALGRTDVSRAYQTYFGGPEQTSAGRWRSRFRRSGTFASEPQAEAHEMNVLSRRFERIAQWFSRNIRYTCPGTGPIRIRGCPPGRCGTKAAKTCTSGARHVAICPPFWSSGARADAGQAGLLIHESTHPMFRFRHHSIANVRARGRNPACYQNYAYSIFRTGRQSNECLPV